MELEGSIHSSIAKYRCKIKKLVSDFLAVYSVCLFVCSDVFFQWAKTAIEKPKFPSVGSQLLPDARQPLSSSSENREKNHTCLLVDLVSIYLIAWLVLFPTLVKEPIAFFWFLWFGLVQHFIQIQISYYCLTYEFPLGVGGISLWHQFRFLGNCPPSPGGGGAFAYETNLGFWKTVLFPPRGLEGHLLMRPI